jgi:hypothetical protein
MSGNPNRDSTGSSHPTAWVVGAITAVLIYALSPGPVAWWVHHRNGGNEPEWVRMIYAPLIAGCQHFQPMGRAYEAYFDWCIN